MVYLKSLRLGFLYKQGNIYKAVVISLKDDKKES